MKNHQRFLVASIMLMLMDTAPSQALASEGAQSQVEARVGQGSNWAFQAVAYDDDAHRQAVADLNAGWRPSLLIDNTWVLVLENPSRFTADFVLRCYDNRGYSTTFNIAIVSGRGTEIGALQGWDGNFVRGERCVAYYDGDAIWQMVR